MLEEIVLKPIGWIENAFDERAAPDEIRAVESIIHLKPELANGLRGLEERDEILVIYYFHKSRGFELIQHRFGDPSQPERGVFDLRSPDRPNPIGVSQVTLLEIKDSCLRVRGLHAINGSPLLDIKPV